MPWKWGLSKLRGGSAKVWGLGGQEGRATLSNSARSVEMKAIFGGGKGQGTTERERKFVVLHGLAELRFEMNKKRLKLHPAQKTSLRKEGEGKRRGDKRRMELERCFI